MMTEQQIERVKRSYANWLDEELNIGFADSNYDMIVRTAEPAQNFIDACREIKSIKHEMMGAMKVTILEGSQRVKGEPRIDLYILEVEDGVTLVRD